ncbi:hypothetical protein BDV38DRAFT_280905 [Aspergillus pseudotamarii]|uniref:ABC transmembrane type-1 domain-containing protein n=1 Tax=Aspergillus pseudotamarii TaxID=132259 RepID=A0A5N6SY42_ASPPS|nr:uncharacterized protein BDV38DRAFT_280905 [Aspergillus pseudotamarii]KAE8139552.1 hypothetical protein BDV38DRAFT_280905 [Aspergillus pseudotamarii]
MVEVQYPDRSPLGSASTFSPSEFISGRIYTTSSAAFRASQSLFHKVLFSVLHLLLPWHDNAPVGYVLSRFSTDVNILDAQVGGDRFATLKHSMEMAAALIAGTIANPYLLIITATLLTMYLWCARRLKTIADPGMVLVMDNGMIVESGSPKE